MSCFECEFSCRILKSILEFDFSNSRSRILKSNFEFVFFVSSLYSISRISIFDSSFEFKFLEFDDSKLSSKFSMSCSIRLLEFRFEFVVEIFVSSLYSTSRISIRICRRNFRFVAQFDFSNFVAQFDFSKFDFSIQVP